MAKEKRSASDLDAELAALEAELAALEGRKKGAPAAPKPAKAAKPPKEAKPAAEPAAEPAKKARFSLPKLGKKPVAPEPGAPEASVVAPAAVEPAPQPERVPEPERQPEPQPASYDLSLWRQEGDAWVCVVPETPVRSVRRILDENGNVVREEPVGAREIESTSAVKAERGLGRLLRRK